MKNNDYMKEYDKKVAPALIEEMKKDPEPECFTVDELILLLEFI